MKRTLLVLGITVMSVAASVVVRAQTAARDERSQFRFEFAQARSLRGLGVEGWAYNDLPWRVTNVRLQVDCLDESGTVTESASGWVNGNVSAGGRAYFFVAVAKPAATYRVSVQSFDKIAREAPTQAP
jgi:hypothetical protein